LRVLIVKMSSMGDIVHAQPVIDDLRAHLSGVVIDWVAERAFAPIPQMNPGVDTVIPIAWRAWRRALGDRATRAALTDFRDRLRQTRYDWVIDCQGLVKSAVVTRLARAGRRAGPSWSSAREPIASLAYGCRARVPWSWHVVARNRAIAAAAFGYRIDAPARFGLTVPRFAPDWLGASGRAVLIPGASRAEKLWPQSHWVAIGRSLVAQGYRLAWLWGHPTERERVIELARDCGDLRDAAQRADAVRPSADDATSIIPPFLSVADAAGLIAQAPVVVGLDTGFTHLAGALGRPTVGIFCDFDANQCAVSGDGPCRSLGGVGRTPSVAEVTAALEAVGALSSAAL
jgi:heptosyltransferase-1